MVRCALAAIALVGCYRDGTVEHCAVTCDPTATVQTCPGILICGTDGFCHPDGENFMGCTAQNPDALHLIDAPARRDAPLVDSAPSDALVGCPHPWSADFATDPTQAGWAGTGFDFAKDVTVQMWEPTLVSEQLSTTPPLAFSGVTTFSALVDVQAVGSAEVDLTVNGSDGATGVQVVLQIALIAANTVRIQPVLHDGNAMTTLPAATAISGPHTYLGVLDYPNARFDYYLDGMGTHLGGFAFAPAAGVPAHEDFEVATKQTQVRVDDLQVCAN